MTEPTLEKPVTQPAEYVKKPIVIQAMRWDGTAEGATPIIDWTLAGDGPVSYASYDDSWNPPMLGIRTLEGWIYASPGDFVIRGVQGEFYPCKPDIFAATYDAA